MNNQGDPKMKLRLQAIVLLISFFFSQTVWADTMGSMQDFMDSVSKQMSQMQKTIEKQNQTIERQNEKITREPNIISEEISNRYQTNRYQKLTNLILTMR